MPEAVIVAACRTAIGTSFKGSLTETPAIELATARDRGSRPAGGARPGRDRRRDLRRGHAGRRRHRQARRDQGRPAAGARPGRPAAVRLEPVRDPGRGGRDHGRDGPRRDRRRRRVRVDRARDAQPDSRHPGLAGPLDAAVASRARPRRRSTTCRSRSAGTPRSWPASPARRWTRGRSVPTCARSRAIDEGRFTAEIVPLKVRTAAGAEIVFDTDEHPRRDTSMDRLAGLKVLHPEIPGFSITAGNSSGINDAASAVVLTSADVASSHGLTPLGVIRGWGVGRRRPGPHRARPDRGDPEGAVPVRASRYPM